MSERQPKIIKRADGSMFVQRKTKNILSEELIEQLARYIRIGCYIETAAVLCGFAKDNFYKWLRDGARQKRGLKRKLLDAVQKAAAEAELRDIARIDKAIEDGNWQAAAWRLERKYPQRWGRKDHIEIEHIMSPDGSPIPISQLTEDEIQKRILEIGENIRKRLRLVSGTAKIVDIDGTPT